MKSITISRVSREGIGISLLPDGFAWRFWRTDTGGIKVVDEVKTSFATAAELIAWLKAVQPQRVAVLAESPVRVEYELLRNGLTSFTCYQSDRKTCTWVPLDSRSRVRMLEFLEENVNGIAEVASPQFGL